MKLVLEPEEELFDVIDGVFAVDMGAGSSGIHDSEVREQLKEYLKELMGSNPNKLGQVMMRFIRRYFLSDENIENGSFLEDLFQFIHWLEDEMSIIF